MPDQPPAPQRPISYGRILRLAWPASLAASVTPLLGAVDVWALAQSAQPLDIAAVGLGAVIFSLAYWSFGFIRMGVAGLTAQAVGARDEVETRAGLARGAAIGAGLGLVILLLQGPIGWIAFKALALDSDASARTFAEAERYFSIRIWGAPFVIATYAALGWFTARERTDYLMIVSVAMTALNIALDYVFVVIFEAGAGGVAAGTLIAEIFGFLAAFALVLRLLSRQGGVRAHWRREAIMDRARIAQTISVNRDIFIRTILLAFSFAWFVQRGGAFGDVTLAANQILLQLFLFTGLALDGTAIAAETLVGQAVGEAKGKGAGPRARYRIAVRRTFELALLAALAFAALYAIAGDPITALLTPEGALRDRAREFMPWIIVSPLIVVIGFQLDGIFVGAARAREMRDSMIVSAALFLPASIALADRFGNHGLWLAFSLYFLMRAATLGYFLPRLSKIFEES